MPTLSVTVTVSLALGVYWARAGTGLRFRAAVSRRDGPEAAKDVAAAYLGCEPSEVVLSKTKPGVYTATCSALPQGDQ